MSRSRRSNRAHSEPYCLHCYSPLERPEGVGIHCAVCGAHNLRVDIDKYWTREERLVRTQSFLRAVVVALVVALTAGTMWPLVSGKGGMHGFAGVGVAFAFPFLLGFLLWDACGLLTRRETVLRHETVWPLLPLTLLVAPCLIIMMLLLVSSSWGSLASGGVLALGGLASGGILWLIAKRAVGLVAKRRASYLERRLRGSAPIGSTT